MNLRTMLSESKDATALMVDLAYGSVFFGDPDMANEVVKLWENLTELTHRMRVKAILAARTPMEAEEMATILQVIGAIEDLGRDAVDIARIASQEGGIPPGLLAALSDSESMLSRVEISDGSRLAGAPLSSFQLPLNTGNRVIAVRSGDAWDTSVEGSTVLNADDVVVLIGPPSGLARVRELAGSRCAGIYDRSEVTVPTDITRAVDLLAEMKTLSEVAVGLAYAVLLTDDLNMAAEVSALAKRLDELKDLLQRWALQAAHTGTNKSGLASLILLSQAAEDLGDRAADMVRHVTIQHRIHPVLAIALGESDEVAKRIAVADGSVADGSTLRDLTAGTGFDVLAIRRYGRYEYRPAADISLRACDELIITGPQAGRLLLLERCT